MRWSKSGFIVLPKAKWAASFFAVCIVAPLLGGCDQIDKYIGDAVKKHQTTREDADIRELKNEIAQLKYKVATLEPDLTKMQQELASVKFSQTLMQSDIDGTWQSSVVVNEGGSYGVARTTHGPVILSMEKVEPYLDGYKVTLNVGNPTTVIFSDAVIEVDWGLPWADKGKSYADISASRKKKSFNILRSFQGGAYTAVDVALTPAKAEEVKSLIVGVTWNKINMRRTP